MSMTIGTGVWIFFIVVLSLIFPSTNSLTTMNHRIELFFKNNNDLAERVKFLNANGFHAFNLVNKNQQDTMEEWVNCILEECGSQAHVCAHFSLKYNKVARKGIPEHRQQLQKFLDRSRAQEVLIISGSGKKTDWNTIKALKATSSTDKITLAVAYNPYFPNVEDQTQEDQRLEQKLGTGAVGKVYLQFGTDLVRLKAALEKLQNRGVAIAGSLFLPTAKLIAQQKFRPWNGVFLNKEFLSGPENAESIVLEMMKLYKQYNAEMLWEAPGIRNEKDLQIVMDLISKVDLQNGASTRQGEKKNDDMANEDDDVAQANLVDTSGSKESKSSPPKRQKLETNRSGTGIMLFGSHDVRLRDNQALEQALRRHENVVPCFLWAPQGQWGVTGALEVVLQEALFSLESSLKSFHLSLVCRNCNDDGSLELVELAKATNAAAVYWNREYTPESRLVSESRREALEKAGVVVVECQSSLLYDPDLIDLETGFHGGHWGTLMPFVKHCKKHFGEPRRPTPYHETFRLLQEVKELETTTSFPKMSVADLNMAIIPGKVQWDKAIRERFPMSEAAGREAMEEFFQKRLRRYESERSRADKEFATSKLSPHLRIGTISPNELFWRTEDSGLGYDELKTFSRRLFWRDLASFQLKCFPDMRNTPIRKHYQKMSWVTGDEERRRFEAWKWGKTGFPIVDAGMRELYATGWMTQSVRMVVASFLVEYLRVNWVKGCEWFHYTLVDADSAINAMMWNNAGKSGIDQWNFILSPVTASQDPSGDYTREWVPELANLPSAALVHRPWEAPKEVLERANVVLGETYPERVVVDLKAERALSVESTLEMRRKSQDANTDRGYDLIHLPSGKNAVVFTKKEYRIGRDGQLLTKETTRQRKASLGENGKKLRH